jgi:hypothetical protein
MKPFLLLSALLLITPMALLNPLGRSAFIGFYVGVVATWVAYLVALRANATKSSIGS